VSECGVPKPRQEPVTEEQLAGWGVLERFLEVLERHAGGIAPNRREDHGLREVDRRTYFGLFNPVVASMRALCAATRLRRVSQTLELDGPVHSSGFSDAQHVFAPEILEPVMRGLLAESLARNLARANARCRPTVAGQRPNRIAAARPQTQLRIILRTQLAACPDSSVLPPALCNSQNEEGPPSKTLPIISLALRSRGLCFLGNQPSYPL